MKISGKFIVDIREVDNRLYAVITDISSLLVTQIEISSGDIRGDDHPEKNTVNAACLFQNIGDVIFKKCLPDLAPEYRLGTIHPNGENRAQVVIK